MDLYEQHKSILEMAVRRQGFHYLMPEGGREAMASGLVEESDPTLDDVRRQPRIQRLHPHGGRKRAGKGAGHGLPVRALRNVQLPRAGTGGGPALRRLPVEHGSVRDERARRSRLRGENWKSSPQSEPAVAHLKAQNRELQGVT